MESYSIEYVPVGDDGEYYWHLYLGTEKVNGGLAADYIHAVGEADYAKWRDAEVRRRNPAYIDH